MTGCPQERRLVRGPSLPAWLGLVACVAALSCGSADPDSQGGSPAVSRIFEEGDVRVTLMLDRESLTIAESVLMRLEVESSESSEVRFPDSRVGFGEFAVTRDYASQARLLENGRVVRGREYVLQPFLPGEYELPALQVSVGPSSQVSTEPVLITVGSVLDDPQTAELEDATHPIDIPAPLWWAVAGAGIALALATAAWWWWRRSKAASAPPPVPAHQRALAAIEALLAEDILSQTGFKPFYLRLSDIVRRYVEERFGLRAPERTTQEFLAEMASASSIRSDHQALLRGFLRQADMVKFAEFVPSAEEAGAAVDAAKRFVQQTVPDEGVLVRD